MSTLRFDDGMSFDTSGPLRISIRRDGMYVVGDARPGKGRTRGPATY